MGNMIDVVNTILDNASEEYTTRVPQATANNIAAVAAPIMEYSSVQNEFLTTLVNRIALTLVRNKIAKNPLAVLKKGGVPLGSDIQDIYTNMAKGEHFDPTGATLLNRNLPDTKAIYYRLNRQDQYTATISRQQLQQAFISWGDLENMLSGVVNSLYSGDNYDEFILMKNTLANAITKGYITNIKVEPLNSKDNTAAFVKAIKSASTFMTFPSSNFNTYIKQNPKDVKPVITWTPMENQVLILRADAATEIDIDVLAVAFNLSKAELLARTLIVDSFGSASNCYAVLCDAAWMQVYDNLQELTEFYNAKGLYWNYFWNHWQTYASCSFANAIAFCHEQLTPTVSTVVVSPATATIAKGGSLDFDAVITGEDNPDQDVTWGVTGALSDNTVINANGYLEIGEDETATEITVVATSVQDGTKTGNATVTIS
jgi:hypothetical protein